VPAGCVDIARRLASENDVKIAELWSFHTIGDQTRFTLVHRATPAEVKAASRSAKGVKTAAKAAAPAARKKTPAKPARKTARRK